MSVFPINLEKQTSVINVEIPMARYVDCIRYLYVFVQNPTNPFWLSLYRSMEVLTSQDYKFMTKCNSKKLQQVTAYDHLLIIPSVLESYGWHHYVILFYFSFSILAY